MFRHDDLGGYDEVIAETHEFEGWFEEVAGLRGGELGEPVTATAWDEVKVSCVLVSDEVGRHSSLVDEGLVDWKP